jgi:hypothetical protein
MAKRFSEHGSIRPFSGGGGVARAHEKVQRPAGMDPVRTGFSAPYDPFMSAGLSRLWPEFDPAAVFPEIAQLRVAVSARNWSAVSSFFAGLADENDRSFAVGVVGKVGGAENGLQEVVARGAPSTLPSVLLASRYIDLGWKTRTARSARLVSRKRFAVFHDHLRRAERLLIDVTAREPHNAMAWAERLLTARGLELGQSEARRRYDRLAEHHPHHFMAQSRLLQQLCPKWGGTWEEMHAFARACMLAAPPGSLSPVLVAEGHLERWLHLGGTGTQKAKRYMRRQPQVREEIVEAAHRSVLDPAFRSRYGWRSAHNVFAAAFSLMGERKRAAVHFRSLGNVASDHPWYYFADKSAAFRVNRTIALVRG